MRIGRDGISLASPIVAVSVGRLVSNAVAIFLQAAPRQRTEKLEAEEYHRVTSENYTGRKASGPKRLCGHDRLAMRESREKLRRLRGKIKISSLVILGFVDYDREKNWCCEIVALNETRIVPRRCREAECFVSGRSQNNGVGDGGSDFLSDRNLLTKGPK